MYDYHPIEHKTYLTFFSSYLIDSTILAESYHLYSISGEKYNFGCICLSHPKVYIDDDELVDYLSWLSDFIKEYFDIFYTLEMEEACFFTNIYYTDSFLSLELFDSDFFKQIASYKISISIPMNIYKVTEQEIIEMLRNRPY